MVKEQDWREVFPWVLKEELRKKQIGGAELARIIGIDQRIIYNFLKGTETPTYDDIDDISYALDCSPEVFTNIKGLEFEHVRIQMRSDELMEIDDRDIRRRNRERPVRIIETGETFPSVKDCAQYIGVKKQTIVKHMKNHTKNCFGLSVEFIDYDEYEYRYDPGKHYRI